MSKDLLFLGPVPCDEDCAQVGSSNYRERATDECARFIALIEKKVGTPPKGARLKTLWQPHDFGSYAEVVVEYNDKDDEAIDYAFRCESEAPTSWEEGET